jgi:hypothetical protein
MGYGYIAAPHAAEIGAFYEQHFNSYLNFHRPCGVPESVVDAKGKAKKKYRWYATPPGRSCPNSRIWPGT